MTKKDSKITAKKISPLETRIQELEAELLETQEKLQEESEKALRALADLQNFQRRESEAKSQWSTVAVVQFLDKNLKKLLELQLAATHTSDEDVKKVIESTFASFEENGLVKIAPQAGEELNTDEHEVLMTAEGEAGTIVQTLEPGWKYQEKVIQPAKVSATLQ